MTPLSRPRLGRRSPTRPFTPARRPARLAVTPLEDRSVPAAAFGSAFSVGETGEWAKDIAAEADGNTYVAGMFNRTVDFDRADADPATNPHLVLTSHSYVGSDGVTRYTQDGFVAKYDPSGACLWAVGLGSGASQGADWTEAVAVDSATGNVFVTGMFAGTADFGPFQRTALGADYTQDGYVAMLDRDGTVRWVHQFGGAYESDAGLGVAVDPATGHAYVTGRLDLTEGGYNDNFDIYVARFDAAADDADGSNAPVWSKQIGGGGLDQGMTVAVDTTGAVVVGGTFRGSVDFDPGPGSYKLSSGGRGDESAFVLKLAGDGKFAWAVNFQVSSFSGSRADDLATDSRNNVYVTGGFVGTVDFDPGKGKLNLPNAGGYDIFAVKLTPAGALAWAKSMGGSDNDNYFTGGGITVDRYDNVYVTGHFNTGTADYTAQFGDYTLRSFGKDDAFVAKLSGGTGTVLWAYAMGGAGTDRGEGIAVDGLGNVYVTGFFHGPFYLDPLLDPTGAYTPLDDSGAGYAAFVVKLTQDNW